MGRSDSTKLLLSATILSASVAFFTKKPLFFVGGLGLAISSKITHKIISDWIDTLETDKEYWKHSFPMTVLGHSAKGFCINTSRLVFNDFHSHHLALPMFGVKLFSATLIPYIMDRSLKNVFDDIEYESYSQISKDLLADAIWEGFSFFIIPKVCSRELTLQNLILEVSLKFIANTIKECLVKHRSLYESSTYQKAFTDACIHRLAKGAGCLGGEHLREKGYNPIISGNAHYAIFSSIKFAGQYAVKNCGLSV